VTLDVTCVSGTSTCDAETTTDSDNALIASVIVPMSPDAEDASTLTASARKPSSATRSVRRPLSGDWIVNWPFSVVVTVLNVAPSPDTRTRAPTTGRPS
jgi:hypothetical protein